MISSAFAIRKIPAHLSTKQILDAISGPARILSIRRPSERELQLHFVTPVGLNSYRQGLTAIPEAEVKALTVDEAAPLTPRVVAAVGLRNATRNLVFLPIRDKKSDVQELFPWTEASLRQRLEDLGGRGKIESIRVFNSDPKTDTEPENKPPPNAAKVSFMGISEALEFRLLLNRARLRESWPQYYSIFHGADRCEHIFKMEMKAIRIDHIPIDSTTHALMNRILQSCRYSGLHYDESMIHKINRNPMDRADGVMTIRTYDDERLQKISEALRKHPLFPDSQVTTVPETNTSAKFGLLRHVQRVASRILVLDNLPLSMDLQRRDGLFGDFSEIGNRFGDQIDVTNRSVLLRFRDIRDALEAIERLDSSTTAFRDKYVGTRVSFGCYTRGVRWEPMTVAPPQLEKHKTPGDWLARDQLIREKWEGLPAKIYIDGEERPTKEVLMNLRKTTE